MAQAEARAWPYFVPRAMGRQNGRAQALILLGGGCRPETYRL